MRVLSLFKLSLVSNLLVLAVVGGSSSPSPTNVQVTLRGKKYDLNDVTTVGELQERLSEASGVGVGAQGRVLFHGKRLDAAESLTSAGVSEGDQLNLVPSSKKAASSSSNNSKSNKSNNHKSKSKSSATTTTTAVSPATTTTAASSTSTTANNQMKDLLESSGVDTNQLDEMVKSMGGGGLGGMMDGLGGMMEGLGGGADGKAPDMAESMEMMSSMMNSPIFQEYMNDPEKLEESRQMILNNPMLKGMMAGMPGMEQLLESPQGWRDAMQAAASLYQNMDQDDLMSAMMGGGGMGSEGNSASGGAPPGMPPGLFDNVNTAALDELSEGEE